MFFISFKDTLEKYAIEIKALISNYFSMLVHKTVIQSTIHFKN